MGKPGAIIVNLPMHLEFETAIQEANRINIRVCNVYEK